MVKISKNEHYFSRKPKSKKKKYHFKANVFGFSLEFVTASGVFSPRRLDLGSLTLMKYMRLKKNGKILDFGCGYGAIGIFAAKACPTSNVTLVDINKRAVWAAKKNVKINKLENAKVKQTYMFSSLKNEFFDVILVNPPISAGLDVCFEIVENSYEHLKEGGSLQLVAKKRKGGKRISEKMEELFGNLDVLGKKAGYWVYKSIKKDLKK